MCLRTLLEDLPALEDSLSGRSVRQIMKITGSFSTRYATSHFHTATIFNNTNI